VGAASSVAVPVTSRVSVLCLCVCACLSLGHMLASILAEPANGKAAAASISLRQRPLGSWTRLQPPGRMNPQGLELLELVAAYNTA